MYSFVSANPQKICRFTIDLPFAHLRPYLPVSYSGLNPRKILVSGGLAFELRKYEFLWGCGRDLKRESMLSR